MIDTSSITNRVFKNDNGKVVLLQKPNLALIVWLVSIIITKITEGGTLQQVASIVSFGAITLWAGLELFQGVNYFRRSLGLIVLIISVYGQIS